MSWFRRVSWCLWLMVVPGVAQAARPARVDLDVVEVREGPSERHPVVFSLTKGTGVASANEPIEGFYKIRALDGRIGWVPADSLLMVESGSKEAGTPTGSGSLKKDTPDAPRRKWVGIRLLGGYGFFIPSEINAIINTNAIQNGIHAGVEVGLLFSERFSAWVRAERIFQLAYALETGGNVYQWDLSSWPVMAGGEFKIWSNPYFMVNMGVLGGVGFATDFSSTWMNTTQTPTRSTYFGMAFGFLARAGFSWTPVHWLQLGLEGGYRFLRTPSMAPAAIAYGSEILQDNGQYRSISIDMSGPFGGVVLGFQF